jgi:hypothetical protein
MIARVLIDLKRYVAAYEELAQVIEEAEAVKKRPEKYEKTADAARALREELEEKLGFVEVTPPARVKLEGEAVAPEQWGKPIAVSAGTTVVSIEHEDGTEQTEELDIAAGETASVSLIRPSETPTSTTTTKDDDRPVPTRVVAEEGAIKQTTVAYVAGGVGAAGLLSFAIFGVLDNKKFSDLESGCSNGVCPPELHDDAEKGRTYQALANVGLGVGLVGIGSAAALYLTAPRRDESARRPRPHVAVGPGSITVKGRF